MLTQGLFAVYRKGWSWRVAVHVVLAGHFSNTLPGCIATTHSFRWPGRHENGSDVRSFFSTSRAPRALGPFRNFWRTLHV